MGKGPLFALLFIIPALAAGALQTETSGSVTVDGVSIHYCETGNPSGRPLVLLHGLYGTVEDFLPLMRVMKPEYRCIAFDMPGCGLSDKPDIHYSMAYFVETTRKFTDALGLKSFVLAGHSLGGAISVHFVAVYPEAVEKIILIDPYGLKGEEGDFLPLTQLGFLVDVAFFMTTEFIVNIGLTSYIFHDPDRIPNEYFASVVRTFQEPYSRRAASRITQEIIGKDPVDDLLPGTGQEVLLIWGENDNLLPASWREGFLKGLPRVTLRLIPDCGHMPIVELPGRTAWLLEEFLQ
jgi:2-hydroxy-6-oxonona-2,4-dienedioate hydrolase